MDVDVESCVRDENEDASNNYSDDAGKDPDSCASSGIERDTPGDSTSSRGSYSPPSSTIAKYEKENASEKYTQSHLGSKNDLQNTPEKENKLNEEVNATYDVRFMGLDDNDSICSTDEEDDKNKPNIPDGGWGWMIVLSSLIISMIADGISFTFGLMYVEFLDEFKASKSKTAWIGSLFIAVPLLAGPVMSALVDKYGCRSMTIVGGIIASLGFALASIANSIEMMFLTFGVIAGLGLGLVYVTAVVSIAYWFDKKRTLAVGLGACGTGVGTFVYAPMTTFFIEEYAWRGTLLLLAGTLLNLCVCGAIMRDPDWWIEEQKKQAGLRSKRSLSSVSISGRSGGGDSVYPGIEELRALMKSGEPPDYILTRLAASIRHAEHLQSTTEMNKICRARTNSVVHLPTFLKQSEKVPIEVLECLSANKRLYNIILENYPSLLNFRSNSEQTLPTGTPEESHKQPLTMAMKLKVTPRSKSEEAKEEDIVSDPAAETLLPKSEVVSPTDSKLPKQDSKGSDRREWLKKQFSINCHYLRDMRVHKSDIMHRNAIMSTSKYRFRASSCPNIYKNSMITIVEEDQGWCSVCWDVLSRMFDMSLFLEWHFLVLGASTVTLFTWFIVPYFSLAEHLTRRGYQEEDAASLLSIIGFTNTIGMIVLGWAGDQPWVSVSKTFSSCLAGCGVCVALFPLLDAWYWAMAINAAVFGLLFASPFSLTPGLLVQLVPLERFGSAYGLVLLCQGLGHLLGPPLSGLLFDLTGDWTASFVAGGASIAGAGLLLALIPYTRPRTLCRKKSHLSRRTSLT